MSQPKGLLALGSNRRIAIHYPPVLAGRGADVLLKKPRKMTLLGEPEVLRQQAQRSTALTLQPGKSPAHARVVQQQGRRHAGIFLEQRKEVRPRQPTSPRGIVDRVRIIEVLEQPGGTTAHARIPKLR